MAEPLIKNSLVTLMRDYPPTPSSSFKITCIFSYEKGKIYTHMNTDRMGGWGGGGGGERQTDRQRQRLKEKLRERGQTNRQKHR